MYWYVDSIVQKDSKLMPGSTTYHIELINIKTRERRVTYIEERFRNSAHWREVINNHPQGQIISNLVTWGKDKINADSQPQVEYLLPQLEMQEILRAQWQHTPPTEH